MKTDLWIMLSIGVAVVGGVPRQPVHERLGKATKNEVEIVLTYGARSGCFGSGPCRIELADGQPYIKQEGIAKGLLRYSENGRLALSIEAGSMTETTRSQQLGNGRFELPEAFAVSGAMITSLGIPADTAWWLPPGLYDAPLENGYYHIIF